MNKISPHYSEDLKKIAADNTNISKAGGYQVGTKWIAISKQSSSFHDNLTYAGKISVVQETTLSGLRRYENSVALNFASGNHPGGGYTGGAKAQEESLCRASNLYEHLCDVEEFYEVNNSCGSALFTDAMIHTKEVTFFRDEKHNLLDEPFIRGIITAPAPKFNKCNDEEKAKVPGIFTGG